jgi:hypothetical protein
MSDLHIHKKYFHYLNLMFSYKKCLFLDTLEKLRKENISFVMSVCPSALNNSASTERIFMKFGFRYVSKICPENSSFIKIWKDYLAKFFLLRRMFLTKVVEKIKNTHMLFSIFLFLKDHVVYEVM